MTDEYAMRHLVLSHTFTKVLSAIGLRKPWIHRFVFVCALLVGSFGSIAVTVAGFDYLYRQKMMEYIRLPSSPLEPDRTGLYLSRDAHAVVEQRALKDAAALKKRMDPQ